MAERAHQSRAGPHFYAILARKRDTALQTRNAVAHRNGIEERAERIDAGIPSPFGKTGTHSIGKTAAQNRHLVLQGQGNQIGRASCRERVYDSV